jgi:hypothetical protein
MAVRNLFFVVVLIGVIALTAVIKSAGWLGGKSSELTDLSEAEIKAATVHLERHACYGTCPVYTVTIHGDGRVEYSGENYVKVKGTQEARVEPAVVKTLLAEFARVRFLSLPDYALDKCSCRRCTDFPSAITEISAGRANHRVKHNHGCGCAPKGLFELESAIDKAANSEQWTGDVSHAGPYGTTCF